MANRLQGSDWDSQSYSPLALWALSNAGPARFILLRAGEVRLRRYGWWSSTTDERAAGVGGTGAHDENSCPYLAGNPGAVERSPPRAVSPERAAGALASGLVRLMEDRLPP